MGEIDNFSLEALVEYFNVLKWRNKALEAENEKLLNENEEVMQSLLQTTSLLFELSSQASILCEEMIECLANVSSLMLTLEEIKQVFEQDNT